MEDLSEVRVLVTQEAGWWVAVCLEHFIAAQAKSLEQVEDSFAQMFVAHYLNAVKVGRRPFSNLKPAPKRYHDSYESAEPLETRDIELESAGLKARAVVRKAA